jgi:predicted transcriptional regulator
MSHYDTAQDAKSLMQKMGLSNRTKFKNKYINPLIDGGLLEMTIPDKPNSSLQKYRITELGKRLKGKL